MRRALLGLALLVFGALALPPLWFALFPETPGELPPAGRRVAVGGGVHVNVLEQGSGPAVVLIHGLPGSAYDWRVLMPALAARGFRVLAYDRVGYGHSDARADGDYTIAANARELLALVESFGLRDATLVGWSYGGSTALAAARADRSRIARLVLVGSAGPGDADRGPPPAVAWIMAGPVLTWLRAVPPLSRGLRAAISEAAFSGQPQPEWWLPDLNANFARASTALAYREEMRGMVGPLPDPAGLDLPVLVIHGHDDRLAPLAIAHELHRRASHGQLVVVGRGSHMLPVTHAPLLVEQIAGFAGH